MSDKLILLCDKQNKTKKQKKDIIVIHSDSYSVLPRGRKIPNKRTTKNIKISYLSTLTSPIHP